MAVDNLVRITMDKLREGVTQSACLLLFLNDEVGVCRKQWIEWTLFDRLAACIVDLGQRMV